MVVEELLEGPEVSVISLVDGGGERVLVLPPAQDHKRIFDGDRGPNTGGMGTFAPAPGFDGDAVEELVELTCRPVLAELAERGHPFVSLIAAGPVVQRARRTPGAELVPVDSEHCAIHQCLRANDDRGDGSRRLVLTASGGPFRGRTAAELADVTVDDALAHPDLDRWAPRSRSTRRR